MALPFIVAGSILGGILSASSAEQERRQQRKNIREAQNILRESKTTSKDMTIGISNINRFFNANISNVLNSTALKTRGVINAPVVAGATVAPIAGQSAMAQAEYLERQQTRNKDIDRQVAMIGLNMPSGSSIGDFVGGAIQGGIAGAQIGKIASGIKKVDNENFDPKDSGSNKSYFTLDSNTSIGSVALDAIKRNQQVQQLPVPPGPDLTVPEIPSVKTKMMDLPQPMVDNFKSESKFNVNPIKDMVDSYKSEIENTFFNKDFTQGFGTLTKGAVSYFTPETSIGNGNTVDLYENTKAEGYFNKQIVEPFKSMFTPRNWFDSSFWEKGTKANKKVPYIPYQPY